MVELVFYSSFFDEKSILIVTHSGQIKELRTPFKVLCLGSIKELKENNWVLVNAVYATKEGKIIYRVSKNYFYHFHFAIILLA